MPLARAPQFHHPLDEHGQPLDGEPRPGRRPSRFIVPVPASRKKTTPGQGSLDLETYTENALINEIRGYLDGWRGLRNPADWGVTGATQRLRGHIGTLLAIRLGEDGVGRMPAAESGVDRSQGR